MGGCPLLLWSKWKVIATEHSAKSLSLLHLTAMALSRPCILLLGWSDKDFARTVTAKVTSKIDAPLIRLLSTHNFTRILEPRFGLASIFLLSFLWDHLLSAFPFSFHPFWLFTFDRPPIVPSIPSGRS